MNPSKHNLVIGSVKKNVIEYRIGFSFFECTQSKMGYFACRNLKKNQ